MLLITPEARGVENASRYISHSLPYFGQYGSVRCVYSDASNTCYAHMVGDGCSGQGFGSRAYKL